MMLSILCLSLLAAEQGKPLPAGWVESASKDKKVSFAMPGKPVERVINQKIPQGEVEILDYSMTNGNCLYRLEKSSLPIPIPEAKLDGALGAIRDSIGKKTKILEDKESTIAGWPARELIIEAPLKSGADPSRIAMLIFYADNELYQVRVFALKPGETPKDFRPFFDSIKPARTRKPD